MPDSQPSGFSISTIAIRQHIGTLMLTLTVIVLGVFFVNQLQVDLLPSITYPRVGVEITAPGVSPDVAINEITRPLEQGLAVTEGVEQIFSRTQEGRVRVDMFFQPGGNIDRALNDATAAYNRVRSRLPDNVEEPRIFKFDPSQLPLYELALSSPTLSPMELRVFADEELGRELSIIPGVAAVDVAGGLREEVRVMVDLDRLQAVGVGLTDVLNTLGDRNQDVSGGRLQGGRAEALTRTIGRFQTVDEIRDLSFESGGNGSTESSSSGSSTASAESGGTPSTMAASDGTQRVYLRDFAQVLDGAEQQRIYVTLNGKPAVRVSIQKQADANTIEVVEGVKRKLAELRQTGLIPADMELTPTLDESVFIRNSLSNVTSSGLMGTLLAAIAVLLFLGSVRQTLIIVLSIPLATLAAMILMGLFGLSLNVFSLGGLALGVGIVVDNSIVMLENIAEGVGITPGKNTRTPLSRQDVINQSATSSREVESALVASTSTNLVAVLPFLLIGGFFSLLFSELILTISFAVAASILVAITLVPMLASRLLAVRWSSRIGEFWLLKQFNNRFEASVRSYSGSLSRLLGYRLLTALLAFVIFGGSGWWMAGQLSQEIIPRINTGQANLSAQFPPGTPLEDSRLVMQKVDEILLAQPETDSVFTTVGGRLFGRSTTANPVQSSGTVVLKPGASVTPFITKVTQEFDRLNLAGIRLRLSPGQVRGLIVNNSPVVRAELDTILQGDDAESLAQATRQVLAELDEKATLSSFRPDSDPRQPEVQIRPDWERADRLGLTARDIGETIQTAIEGSIPTQLQRGNRLVDIRVQLAQATTQRASELERLPLFIDDSRQIRLSDVAKIQEGRAPTEVQLINQRQVSVLVGDLKEDASLSDALAEVKRIVATMELPKGVRILPSAIAATNQQLQQSIQLLGGLATFLVFVVMAVQYNSLIDPLVIMLTVPLGLAGGIFGLYVTGTAIGATVLVGAVLLIGIVVNNAIIMVELANQIRERDHCDRQTAILQAAPQRLRPILMTTITTVLGMFPLALGIGQGSEFLQPLGVVVFAGLSLATLLTLFVIPCFYVLLHEVLNWDWWDKRVFYPLRRSWSK
jgi:multidrug efflux pump subunit AcrB